MTDLNTLRQTGIQAYRQANRQTDRHRQAEGQTGRRNDKQEKK
jgi:hypothetical protein